MIAGFADFRGIPETSGGGIEGRIGPRARIGRVRARIGQMA